MTIKNKSLVLRMALIICLSISIGSFTFSYISNNGTEGAYGGTQGSSDGKRVIGAAGIGNFIVEGAGSFLGANSHIQRLLQIVELNGPQGIKSDQFINVLDNAIVEMGNALNSYELLIQIANLTPYDPVVINKLAYFDYYNFMYKNDLNYSIFYEVEWYLRNGWVTPIFKRTHFTLFEISQILDMISSEISQGRLPEIKTFRQLNHKIAEISLFGSYVAEVFDAIKQ